MLSDDEPRCGKNEMRFGPSATPGLLVTRLFFECAELEEGLEIGGAVCVL